MLETSKDILNVAIAAAVVIFTFFLCWGLFYIAMILKRANATFKEVSELINTVKEKLDRLEKLLIAVEEKIKNSASYLPLVFKGITELIDYFKKKKEAKTTKRKNQEK